MPQLQVEVSVLLLLQGWHVLNGFIACDTSCIVLHTLVACGTGLGWIPMLLEFAVQQQEDPRPGPVCILIWQDEAVELGATIIVASDAEACLAAAAGWLAVLHGLGLF